MKVNLSIFSVAAAAVMLTAGCQSFCSGDKAVAIQPSGTRFAAEAMQKFIDSGEIPGTISVLRKGNVQELCALGWADVDKKIPIDPEQMFMQCSQTKGFCGVTIAMLVEQGRIDLDDPVSKYLPEFKNLKVAVLDKNGKRTKETVPAKNVLTIRMVMNHTGGFNFEIPTKVKKGWPALSLRDTAKEAARQALLFEPGTNMRYSNTGIDIGAAVVEVVTGQPWDEFLKENVLLPLGMKNTTFQPTDEQLKNIISLYNVKAGTKAKYRLFHSAMPLPHNGPGVHPSAGAGLWTTTSDQLKFYAMLMNLGVGDNGVRILKEETVKNLLALSTRPKNVRGLYSLGLHVNNQGSMGHGGAWGTSCHVDWKNKQLRMRVVQNCGRSKAFNQAWAKAAEKFFNAKLDNSGEAYTGRMQ